MVGTIRINSYAETRNAKESNCQTRLLFISLFADVYINLQYCPRDAAWLGLAWLGLAACFAPSPLHATEGYSVAIGSTLSITEFGVCKQVTNTSTTNVLWVPTYSAGEWSSFYTNPGSATVASCPAACSGVTVGGYCWYIGAANQTCNTVCTGHGGYNAATQTYGGASQANCAAIFNAAGIGYVSSYGPAMYIGGYDCSKSTNGSLYVCTATGSGNYTVWGVRACACNN